MAEHSAHCNLQHTSWLDTAVSWPLEIRKRAVYTLMAQCCHLASHSNDSCFVRACHAVIRSCVVWARLNRGLAEDLLRRRARVHVVAHLVGPQMDEVLQVGHLPPVSKVRAGLAALACGFWCSWRESSVHHGVRKRASGGAPARDGSEAIEGHARSASEVRRVAAVQQHGIRQGKSACAQR